MNSDSFDSEEGITQFLMEDRKEADIDPLSGVEPVNAPFKRPWFQSEDFQLNTGDWRKSFHRSMEDGGEQLPECRC